MSVVRPGRAWVAWLEDEQRRGVVIVSAVLCALLLILPSQLAMRAIDERMPREFMLRSQLIFVVVGCAALVHAIVRGKWGYHLQTLGLSASFLTVAFGTRSLRSGCIFAATWVLGGLLAWKLPIQHKRVRRGAVVVCTCAFFVLWRRIEMFHVIVAFQFLWVSELMATRPERSWLECQRAMCALVSNLPPDQLLGETRAALSRWVGASWLVCGYALLFIKPAWKELVAPHGARSHDTTFWHHSLTVFLASGRNGITFLLSHCGRYLMIGGVVRMMGIPIESPIGNLFVVKNVLEYWATANRWRWKFLRSVYVDNFFPIRRDAWGALSIMAVFLLSGILHGVGTPSKGFLPWSSLERWLAFGVLAAASYYWLIHRIDRRMRALVRGEQPREPGPVQRVGGIVWHVVRLCLVVLSVSVLQHIFR